MDRLFVTLGRPFRCLSVLAKRLTCGKFGRFRQRLGQKMTGTAQSARILIRGGRVYDHDGDVHQPALTDVLVGGERIERIGPNLPADAGVEIIDAVGKLVAPGFINAHYHSHDVMAKGLFEEMPFDIWTLHSNPANY